MIFAVEEADGVPVLLVPEKQVKPGSWIH